MTNKAAKQRTPAQISIRLPGLVLCSLLLLWWGCGPKVPGPLPSNNDSCLRDSDCQEGVCRVGVCVTQTGTIDTGDTPDGQDPNDTIDAGPQETPNDQTPPTEQPAEQTPDGNCHTGSKQKCYTGPAGTEGVGTCKPGTQTCQPDGSWSKCTGEFLPEKELCDGADNDCNGKVDDGLTFTPPYADCPASGKGACNKGQIIGCTNGVLECKANEPTPEVCDGIDNNCDGQVDNNPSCKCQKGETQNCGNSNTGECKKGTQTCQSDGQWGTCVGEVSALKELCDGKDNDCDGQTDEDFTSKLNKECSTGQGECQNKGTTICSADGSNVVCDALPKPSRAESCNGKDDDCDGQTDEDFTNLGDTCQSSGTGACQTTGKYVCATNGASTICNAKEAAPTQETCNGIDDDCDGRKDNVKGKQDPIEQPCYTGLSGTLNIGICRQGQEQCVGGKWSGQCNNQITPTKETCNNIDDDCNGAVDDSCCATPPCCKNGDTQKCGSGTGECKEGTQTCKGNQWAACENEIKPSNEVCDGKDNDCDGQVDENFNIGADCTIGVGECQAKGKFACKNASESQCDATPKSPSNEVCDGKDNNCNGQTDEGNPGGGISCTVSGQDGECKRGKTTCKNGKPACEGPAPQKETCRNQRDEDCDGKVDEICGPQYPHAFVFLNRRNNQIIANFFDRGGGNLVNHSFTSVSRIRSGEYELTPSGFDCRTTPIFLSPYSHYKRSLAYSCPSINQNRYRIHTSPRISSSLGSITITRSDAYFFAVVPNQPHDEWLYVSAGSCNPANSGASACSLVVTKGTLSISRTGTGLYEVKAKRCKNNTSPIFATIQASSPVGFVTAKSLGGERCEIRTYNPQGVLTNGISFAIWLPDPTKVAWAQITPNGANATINASNGFGETWSGTRYTYPANVQTCPPTFNQACNRTRTRFQAWRSPSAILLQSAHTSSNAMRTSSGILGLQFNNPPFDNRIPDIYISSFEGNDPKVVEAPFTILYIQ